MDTGRGRQSPTVSVILPYEDTKGPEAVGRESGGMRSSRPTVKTQFKQNVGRCSLTPPRRGNKLSPATGTSVRTQNR